MSNTPATDFFKLAAAPNVTSMGQLAWQHPVYTGVGLGSLAGVGALSGAAMGGLIGGSWRSAGRGAIIGGASGLGAGAGGLFGARNLSGGTVNTLRQADSLDLNNAGALAGGFAGTGIGYLGGLGAGTAAAHYLLPTEDD